MQNLPDDEKQRLVEYINNHFIMCKYVFCFLNFDCLPQVTLREEDFLNIYFID